MMRLLEERPRMAQMRKNAERWLARHRGLASHLPPVARGFLRDRFASLTFRQETCRGLAESMYGGAIPDVSSYPAKTRCKVGIVRDHMWYFTYNVCACRELGVPYELVDIADPSWLRRVSHGSFDALLVWPSVNHSAWKALFDERLRVLVEVFGTRLIPRLDELWLLDSKRRVSYWLEANGVPAPRTWVFYDRDSAEKFIDQAVFPLVFKTDIGASAAGVRILRSRRVAMEVVCQAFGRGVQTISAASNDWQTEHVLFQEFVPHDDEWRIVRIGNSFLCRRKQRVGDFASGSGAIEYARPTTELLNFAKSVTDKAGFESMAVDVFRVQVADARGEFLVNELQCLVGAKELDVTADAGRWESRQPGDWRFEKGDFYRNACANLRIQHFLANWAP